MLRTVPNVLDYLSQDVWKFSLLLRRGRPRKDPAGDQQLLDQNFDGLNSSGFTSNNVDILPLTSTAEFWNGQTQIEANIDLAWERKRRKRDETQERPLVSPHSASASALLSVVRQEIADRTLVSKTRNITRSLKRDVPRLYPTSHRPKVPES